MSDTLQASIAVTIIKIDGTPVHNIEHDLEEIVVDTTYNLPAMATIRLHDKQLKWVDNSLFNLGKKLSIALGAPKAINSVAPAEVFAGEIVAIEPHFSGLGQHTLTIRAYDKSHRLHLGTKSRTFLDMSDSDIIKKIAGEVGLRVSVEATPVKYKYILQNNQTDMEFMAERARRIGFHLSVQGDSIKFFSTNNPPEGPELSIGDDLRDFSVRMSAARQSTKFVVRGWDFVKKEAIVGQSNAVNAWHQNGESKTGGAASQSAFSMQSQVDILDMVPHTQNEAEKIAAAAATDQEAHFFEADGVAYGNPKIIAGIKINLTGIGKRYSGKYFVTSATHIYNAAGYDVHFTVSGRYPQTFNQLLHSGKGGANQRGLVEGVVVGIVTNVQDPDNYGRVKVKFPWMQNGATEIESYWARIAMPSAGKERGFYFLPEVNDEVLIAFEHGDPSTPYIVGALWNGKDAPPETNADAHKNGKTVHRIIASRLNHKIVFDDSDDKPSILIMDKTGKQSVLIDSNKNSITIEAAGNMLIDAKGNIDIKSGGNINISATGNIKAEGVNVDVNAKGNAKVEATGMLNLKGTGSATLESPAATNIKGSVLNAEASGPAVVKGNPIMLN